MRFMASCLFGLERLVAEDIDALGFRRTDTMDGHVLFEGPPWATFECNVFFRYAERLYIVVGEFEANSFTHPDVTKGKLAKRPQDIVVFLLF